jgi:intracellular multiplication protein IcmP
MVADRKAVWKAEGVTKATVMRDKARQAFAAQLGPLWAGVDNLPPHTKAIYAAFLARAEHDTDSCRGYLQKLARSAAKGTIDYSDTDELLKKYEKCKGAKLAQSRHAYVLTVMASMLVLARVDGVLASSDFLWVKPIDRRLWYTLNCVGRQVAVPEVAGVFAHWLAEKEMARPLSVPMVDEAVNAFEIAISNTVYIPEEGEEIPPQAATS